MIVVDQFEEVFTLGKSAGLREAFVRALRAAAHGDEHGPAALVVLGVRADFYAECMAVPELVPSLREQPVVVGPMSTTELRNAVEKPAARAGFTLEPGLVDVLLGDLGASPLAKGRHQRSYEAGRLPLLSHALKTAWQQRTGPTITVAGYKETGRIHGALAATAELAMSRLDEGGRDAARSLLLRLVRIGEGTEATKRRAPRSELLAEVPDPERAAAVLTAFTMEDTRLITMERDSVEIIHETLLHAWPQLRGWIDENRARLRTEQHLTEAAHAWERAGRDPLLLHTGSRLARAEVWAADEPVDSGNPLALEFVRASEHRQRRSARRRRTAVAVVLCVLVAVAASLGALLQSADSQRREAQSQHRTATARGLVFQAESLRATAPDTALRLGIAAQRLGPSDNARASLMTTLLSRHEPDFLTAHTGPVKAVACSDDGRTIATAGADRAVLLWDTTDRAHPRRIARLTGHHAPVRTLVFAPGGTLLATGGEDRTIILWDVSDPSRPRRLTSITGATSTIEAIAVSPDRHTLLSGGAGRFGIMWDITDLDHPRKLATMEGGTYRQVHSVAFTPDGRTAVIDGAGESPCIWNISDPEHPHRIGIAPGRGAEEVYAVAVAPDGRTLAVAYSGNEVVLWDIRELTTTNNQRQMSVIRAHTRPVHGLAFSPDSLTLATASADHTALLWNVTNQARPRRLAVLNGHTAPVNSVAFTPDGRTVVTGSDDGTAALWDATEQVLPHPTAALSAPDGRVLGVVLPAGAPALAATRDGAGHHIVLWDVTEPDRRRRLASITATQPLSVAFSPDGKRMAVVDYESAKVVLYELTDPTNPQHTSTLTSDHGRVTSAVYGPDGRTLATTTEGPLVKDSNFDGPVIDADKSATILWDVARPTRPQRAADIPAGLNGYVVFSPDQRALFSAADGEAAILWDVRNLAKPRRLGSLSASGGTFAGNLAAAFTPDGKMLALARGDRQAAVLYDISEPSRPREVASLAGHADSPWSLAFGAHGHLLATAANDGTMILWDVTVPSTPRQLTTVTGPTTGFFGHLAFSPDTRTLANVETDYDQPRTGFLWDITPITRSLTDPTIRACTLVHRGLNRGEWKRATAGLPYQRTCPN